MRRMKMMTMMIRRKRKKDKEKDKTEGDGDDGKVAKDKDADEVEMSVDNAEGDFTEEELAGVRWTETEVIKAQRNKYRLENGGWRYDIKGLKDSTIFAVRVRGKNKSGWGTYCAPKSGTTKKLTIDSSILKSKEKEALLKFVTKKERKKKWKLIFSG